MEGHTRLRLDCTVHSAGLNSRKPRTATEYFVIIQITIITANFVFKRYEFTPKHHARCKKKKSGPSITVDTHLNWAVPSSHVTHDKFTKKKKSYVAKQTQYHSVIFHQLCTSFTPAETYSLPHTAYDIFCTIFFLYSFPFFALYYGYAYYFTYFSSVQG